MPSREKLAEFAAWRAKHITGGEMAQAQICVHRSLEDCNTAADTCDLIGRSANAGPRS